ncbi:TPA: NinE family protein [Yersinia enterocolitica]|nr:NinE family protein [Yersinia enterocolitica]HEI6725084.1 NinE family protein [Yersinia enterocolitica]HEI6761412.1 NinE family protein [Yersinia enterocolitica]HEI6827318.1 NinE family protein [Yersinia enterocolitica]HEI6868315.1 NinE family protein [Yersinia enterocolitica]
MDWRKPVKRQRSLTQIAIDNLIFRKSSRTKPKPPIPASQIKTFDYVHGLLQAKFDRVRRTR